MQSNPVTNQLSLDRVELDKLVPEREPLRILADLIDWTEIEENWDKMFEGKEGSPGTRRPATRPRLVASVMLLQDISKFSDSQILTFWSQMPVFQYFSGEFEFKPEKPFDETTLVKWRKRVGKEGASDLLRMTLEAGLKAGAISRESLEKIIIDTTVMSKNTAYPKDCELREKGRITLVREAKKAELPIKYTYDKVGHQLYTKSQRIKPTDKNRSEQFKSVKDDQDNMLAQLIRDIEKKMAGNESDKKYQKIQEVIHTVNRLCFPSKCGNEKRTFSIHEPDIVIVKKGHGSRNTHFGNVVSVGTTHAEGYVVEMEVLKGRPHDSHTLRDAIDRTCHNTSVEVKEVFVDRGYRGHNITDTVVNMSTDKKGIPEQLRQDLNRRTVVEAMIGHMKNEGRLRVCPLKGNHGSQFHALLCGCAQNLRYLLNAIKNNIEKYVPIPPPKELTYA